MRASRSRLAFRSHGKRSSVIGTFINLRPNFILKKYLPNITMRVIGWCFVTAIILGIFMDVYDVNPFEPEIVYAENVKEEPKEVRIEVVIDWDEERIIKEIRDTFPEEPNTAVAVAFAESQLNPKAFNGESHRGCDGSIGVMQMACVHQRSGEDLFDPAQNLKRARAVYDDSKARTGNGWLPWGAYTDGRWKQYL